MHHHCPAVLLVELLLYLKVCTSWRSEAVFTLNKLSISLVAPSPQCSSTYHCLTVMVPVLGGSVGSLARGHVGLESPLCDKGYCTKLLVGCMGGSCAQTHAHTRGTHTLHESISTKDSLIPTAMQLWIVP